MNLPAAPQQGHRERPLVRRIPDVARPFRDGKLATCSQRRPIRTPVRATDDGVDRVHQSARDRREIALALRQTRGNRIVVDVSADADAPCFAGGESTIQLHFRVEIMLPNIVGNRRGLRRSDSAQPAERANRQHGSIGRRDDE